MNKGIGLMKMQTYLILFIAMAHSSCQDTTRQTPKINSNAVESIQPQIADQQIANYIRNMHQDKNGNFWFGTNGYGVAHYDGHSMNYYSNPQGFNGQQITGITEDLDKNIWFSTDQGVVKFEWSVSEEGKREFTNYTNKNYFNSSRFWSIFADSKGNIWAGSTDGIFRFDGNSWTPFKLPIPEEVSGDFITKGTSWSIIEDSKQNIWISTNGFGVFKYDGASFTQYTTDDGLADNSVDVIIEDRNHNIWIGTRFGGVSRFDGKTYTNYSQNEGSIENNEVVNIYEDSNGNIWMSSEGFGVYKYDGTTFSNYSQAEGLNVPAVQVVYEDKDGRIWVGGGGGLFRLDGNYFINITKQGPWI